jgi:hypothetical protein
MHYTISKKEIRQAIHVLKACLHHPDADDAIAMLQGLLAQPEGEPVARLLICKRPFLVLTETVARTYEEYPVQQAKADNCWAESTPLYTSHVPFTPISADDVTDEMVTTYHKDMAFSHYAKYVIAAAVNAWGAKK